MTQKPDIENHELYYSFIRDFHGIAFRCDLNFRPIFFHGAVEKITGYTEKEFVSGNPRWEEIIHKDDREYFRRAPDEFRSIPDYYEEREYRIIRKDGSIRWIYEVIGNICGENGKPIFVQGGLYDITERKMAYEAIWESESRFRLIAEIITDVFWMADCDFEKIYYVSPGYEHIWGRSLESLFDNPSSLIGFIHNKDRERVLEDYDRKKCGLSYDHEYRIIRGDGEVRWIWDRGYPIIEESGKVTRYVGISRDITERKLAFEAIFEGESRFKLIAEAITEVFWLTDVKTEKIFYVSPSYEHIWGRSLMSLYENPQSFLETVFAPDRSRVMANYELKKFGQPYDHEYRIVRNDGTIRWVWDRGFPVIEESGKINRYVSITCDISERRRMETALKEIYKELQDTLKATTDGIWKWNFETGEMSFNPRFYIMLGYEPLDFPATPENWFSLVHPDDLPEFKEYFNKKPEIYENEYRLKSKNGDYKWIRIRGMVIKYDEQGNALRIIGNHEDVTEHKQIQEELIKKAVDKFEADYEKKISGELEATKALIAEKDIKILELTNRIKELEKK